MITSPFVLKFHSTCHKSSPFSPTELEEEKRKKTKRKREKKNKRERG